jgi:hypothetical protein
VRDKFARSARFSISAARTTSPVVSPHFGSKDPDYAAAKTLAKDACAGRGNWMIYTWNKSSCRLYKGNKAKHYVEVLRPQCVFIWMVWCSRGFLICYSQRQNTRHSGVTDVGIPHSAIHERLIHCAAKCTVSPLQNTLIFPKH